MGSPYDTPPKQVSGKGEGKGLMARFKRWRRGRSQAKVTNTNEDSEAKVTDTNVRWVWAKPFAGTKDLDPEVSEILEEAHSRSQSSVGVFVEGRECTVYLTGAAGPTMRLASPGPYEGDWEARVKRVGPPRWCWTQQGGSVQVWKWTVGSLMWN